MRSDLVSGRRTIRLTLLGCAFAIAISAIGHAQSPAPQESKNEGAPQTAAPVAEEPDPAQFRRIKNFQILLKRLGFYHGPVDGRENDATKAALGRFKRKNGLTTDGGYDESSLSKLRRKLSEKVVLDKAKKAARTALAANARRPGSAIAEAKGVIEPQPTQRGAPSGVSQPPKTSPDQVAGQPAPPRQDRHGSMLGAAWSILSSSDLWVALGFASILAGLGLAFYRFFPRLGIQPAAPSHAAESQALIRREECLEAIGKFLRSETSVEQLLTLRGRAGSGKSTILAQLHADLTDEHGLVNALVRIDANLRTPGTGRRGDVEQRRILWPTILKSILESSNAVARGSKSAFPAFYRLYERGISTADTRKQSEVRLTGLRRPFRLVAIGVCFLANYFWTQDRVSAMAFLLPATGIAAPEVVSGLILAYEWLVTRPVFRRLKLDISKIPDAESFKDDLKKGAPIPANNLFETWQPLLSTFKHELDSWTNDLKRPFRLVILLDVEELQEQSLRVLREGLAQLLDRSGTERVPNIRLVAACDGLGESALSSRAHVPAVSMLVGPLTKSAAEALVRTRLSLAGATRSPGADKDLLGAAIAKGAFGQGIVRLLAKGVAHDDEGVLPGDINDRVEIFLRDFAGRVVEDRPDVELRALVEIESRLFTLSNKMLVI